MSNTTPLSAPLGPLTPALDERALAGLPDYLSAAARRSLQEPAGNLLLAALSAGQLLRAGALRQAARGHLVAWFCGLDEEALDVLGGAGEEILSRAADPLGAFLQGSPEAQELLDPHVAHPVVESGETPPAASSEQTGDGNWLRSCVLSRDQAESLIVLLGKIALENDQEARADAAARWERVLLQEARTLDETAMGLVALLGDHLVPDLLEDPWLRCISALQPGHWWTGLLRARQLGQLTSVHVVPAVPQLAAEGTTGAQIILFVPRRSKPAPPAKLAAHADGTPPPAMQDAQRYKQGELRVELARLSDPDAGEDFALSLWLEDGSELSLDPGSVELLDAQGRPCIPVSRGAKAKRWWGVFRGEGDFHLRVTGVAGVIKIDVRREP